MSIDEDEGWERVDDPTVKQLTISQEEVVREQAFYDGVTDLRIYRGYMHRREWTYYDVIKEYYIRTA